MKRITLALTGASGMAYGLRLLECLLRAGCQVDLLISQAARIVAKQELDLQLPIGNAEVAAFFDARYGEYGGRLTAYGKEEWFAPAASGSNPAAAMVVCPCTMGTLGRIAHGYSEDVLLRAADVVLKERKKLILVPRETPLSLIHVKNMELLLLAGATLIPANPSFYSGAKTIIELVDTVVARVLDHIGVENKLAPRWIEEKE